MKKAILIFLISGLLTGFSAAQNLLDIYKKGPVKLEAEKNYGVKNNWGSLFNLYYDTLDIMEGEREEYKKIIVAPDGSVFMSHKNRYEIWKFGPDGNLVKKFGTRGGKASQFPYLPSIEPVVDGKYIFTTDANARLKFFDLDGNYFKSITLKYMTRSFQPTNNGEILLEGNVMWKKTDSKYISYDWRHIIVSLNLYSGEERIIYSVFENADQKFLNTTNPDSMLFFILPANFSANKIYMPNYIHFKRPVFTLLKDGRFILSNRENGEVKVFDNSGKEIYSFKLDLTPIKITEKDVQENYEMLRQSLIKAIEKINASTTISSNRKQVLINQNEKTLGTLERYKDIGNYFAYLPYFSNIILDDEGNFLVFEFTEKDETKSNIFNAIAYDKTGKRLARTSFICDDYDLSFSESTFVFSGGYIYAVAKLKSTTGMPLRLVKFRISN
jgi:hypothetical protein